MDNVAEKLVAGLENYEKYCIHTNTPLDLSPSNERFKLGTGVHESLGCTIMRFPIDNQGNYLKFETEVINSDTPILLGLDSIKQYGWYVNEVTNESISHKDPTMKANLIFKLGHLYLEWPPSVILFSRADLLKIHRRFAHSSAGRLANLLRKAAPDQLDSNKLKLLEDISATCQSCQCMAPNPLAFQVAMPDDIQFNHEVIIDLSWIEPRPIDQPSKSLIAELKQFRRHEGHSKT